MYDVMIIGSGVSGSAAARELSRYKAKICVLEKEEDVCCGTSKANSGIVHAGYDAKEGSLMAKLNVRGNAMMEQLSKDLDFPFKRIGSLVICLREEDMDKLQALYDRGVANGVSGLQILNREEVLEMEPNIADNVYAALYAPTAGIVCPFGLNIAMAENACENGVEFKFDTKVQHLKYKVLREVARHAWDDTLLESITDIPKDIVPGKVPTMRCCVYKERAIACKPDAMLSIYYLCKPVCWSTFIFAGTEDLRAKWMLLIKMCKFKLSVYRQLIVLCVERILCCQRHSGQWRTRLRDRRSRQRRADAAKRRRESHDRAHHESRALYPLRRGQRAA